MREEIPGLVLATYQDNPPPVIAAIDKVNGILNFKGGITCEVKGDEGRVWFLEIPDGTDKNVIIEARAAALQVLQASHADRTKEK